MAVPSQPPVSTRRPSWSVLNAQLNTSSSPCINVNRSSPVAVARTFAVPSQEAVTVRLPAKSEAATYGEE